MQAPPMIAGLYRYARDDKVSDRWVTPGEIILSLEVGKWAGDIEDATLPDSFTVDYVRVYQKSTALNPKL